MASKYIELTELASPESRVTETTLLASRDDPPSSDRKDQRVPVSVQQKLILAFVAIVSSLGGLLLGYDLATFSFPVLDAQQYFSISEAWKQALIYVPPVVASMSAVLGAFASRPLGYRPLVLAGSAVFAVGTVLNAAAVNEIMFFVGRTVSAIGLGLVITNGPVFAAEVSPAENRGKVITVQGQLIAVGGTLSYFFVGYLGSVVESAWPMRLGFALMGLAAVTMFIAFLFFAESYRWLIKNERREDEDALASLLFFNKDPEMIQDMLECLKELAEKEKSSTGTSSSYISKVQKWTLAFIVGHSITVIAQLCLTIRTYADKLESPWVTEGMPVYWLMKILLEVAPSVASSVGLLLVDRVGRRWVLLVSLGGLTASLMLLFGASTVINSDGPSATPLYNDTCGYTSCGACVTDPGCGYCTNSSDILYFNGTCSPGNVNSSTASTDTENTSSCTLFEAQAIIDPLSNQTEVTNDTSWSYFLCPTANGGYAWFALLSVLTYRTFFFFGIQNVVWTVNTEIYPTSCRALPLGIANAIYLISNAVLGALVDAHTTLALPYMYLIFAGLTLLSTVFVAVLFPETNQAELEDTVTLFERPKLESCLNTKFSRDTNSKDEQMETIS